MLLPSLLGISGLRGLGGGAGGSGYPFLLVDAFRWIGKSASGEGQVFGGGYVGTDRGDQICRRNKLPCRCERFDWLS